MVRVSAGEIRKRIAQQYHESGHDAEIRIDLPLGSYLPEFHFPKEPTIAERDAAIVAPVVPERLARRRPVTARTLGVGVAMTLALVLLIAWRPWARQSNVLDQFWAPVLNPAVPVVLCVGRAPLSPGTPATPEQLGSRRPGIGLTDPVTLARLTGLIESKGQPYYLRREERATFSELQEGPAILVG